MTGPRKEEWIKSRQRAGLTVEQVYLQKTPQGDMVIVRLEGDNPAGIVDHFMKSQDPFDMWFKEKILIECHGMDPSAPMMQENEQIINYVSQPAGEKTFTGTRTR